MKKALIAAIVFILASTPKLEVSAMENTTNEVSQNIMENIKKSNISKINIISIPTHILTRTAITQENIERNYYYKIILRNMRDTSFYKSFNKALLSTTIRPKPSPSDLRLGIIFYNENDQRIGAIYFNESGDAGAINDDNVIFGGGLHDWVTKNFSNILW